MKSLWKRWLYLGTSISFIVLAAMRTWGNSEIDDTEAQHGQSENRNENMPPQPLTAQIEDKIEPKASESAKPRAQFERSSAPVSAPVSGVTVSLSGKVVREDGTLAFRENAGALFLLDASVSARMWEGKSVRLTGKLDSATRLLHVEEILPVAAEAGRPLPMREYSRV